MATTTTTDWHALEAQLYMRTFARIPLTLVRGIGALVWDDRGREYLDFFAGLAVNALGHCPPVIVETLREQVGNLIHTTNLYYTVPQLQLAQILVEHSSLQQVFFTNSGAESNEAAIKLARKWGKLQRGGAFEIISTHNSFHGRTLATLAATGQPKYQQGFDPLPPGFVFVPFNDVEALEQAVTDRTVAILLEPVQGEGGVYPATREYLHAARRLCDERNLLLILDEIQTGVARTGTLWAHEQYGIEPDIMTLAKGLGGGVPIGAALAKERAAVFQVGDHGSTFAGNPLACAAGYAVMRTIIDQDIPGRVRLAGARLRAGLEGLRADFSLVTEVRGLGLLLAFELAREAGTDVLNAALERGLLVNRVTPTAIRLVPPLIVTDQQIDRAVEILRASVAAVQAMA